MGDKLRCPHCGGALKVANRRISELEENEQDRKGLVTQLETAWCDRYALEKQLEHPAREMQLYYRDLWRKAEKQLERSRVILKGIRGDRKHLREQLKEVRLLPEKWLALATDDSAAITPASFYADDNYLRGRSNVNYQNATELQAIVGDNDE